MPAPQSYLAERFCTHLISPIEFQHPGLLMETDFFQIQVSFIAIMELKSVTIICGQIISKNSSIVHGARHQMLTAFSVSFLQGCDHSFLKNQRRIMRDLALSH